MVWNLLFAVGAACVVGAVREKEKNKRRVLVARRNQTQNAYRAQVRKEQQRTIDIERRMRVIRLEAHRSYLRREHRRLERIGETLKRRVEHLRSRLPFLLRHGACPLDCYRLCIQLEREVEQLQICLWQLLRKEQQRIEDGHREFPKEGTKRTILVLESL